MADDRKVREPDAKESGFELNPQADSARHPSRMDVTNQPDKPTNAEKAREATNLDRSRTAEARAKDAVELKAREDAIDAKAEAADADAKAPEDSERKASMSMTKDELLERLGEVATKAEILEHIHRIEAGDEADEATVGDTNPLAGRTGPFDTATRTATVNGQTYTWTEASEGAVPEEARLVWARSQGAGV